MPLRDVTGDVTRANAREDRWATSTRIPRQDHNRASDDAWITCGEATRGCYKRRLAEADEPTKEPMPSWMFEEVQEPGAPVDSPGGPDLASVLASVKGV